MRQEPFRCLIPGRFVLFRDNAHPHGGHLSCEGDGWNETIGMVHNSYGPPGRTVTSCLDGIRPSSLRLRNLAAGNCGPPWIRSGAAPRRAGGVRPMACRSRRRGRRCSAAPCPVGDLATSAWKPPLDDCSGMGSYPPRLGVPPRADGAGCGAPSIGKNRQRRGSCSRSTLLPGAARNPPVLVRSSPEPAGLLASSATVSAGPGAGPSASSWRAPCAARRANGRTRDD